MVKELKNWLHELVDSGVEEGRRHISRFKIIIALKQAGWEDREIEEILLKFNSNCRPPEDERAVKYHLKNTLRQWERFPERFKAKNPEWLYEKLEEVKDVKPKSLGEIYLMILDVLDFYMDMDAEDKKIIALWLIGVNFIDSFITYPILNINASKGSGKTRLLKLMHHLIADSELAANLSESALFRIPTQKKLKALLIDEAERLGSREKANLRELLNQAYKRGGKILREKKNPRTNEMVLEEFQLFLGIALANIWGLESVLEDRCITIRLRKSGNAAINSIMEYFEDDPRILEIKRQLLVYVVYVCRHIFDVGSYIFNQYLLYHTQHTNTTQDTQLTQLTQNGFNIKDNIIEIATHAIQEQNFLGRELEIWSPLLSVALSIDEKTFFEAIEIAKKKCIEKKSQEVMDDRDTIFSIFLYNFLNTLNDDATDMIPIRKIKDEFEKVEGQKDWLTSEWVGRCLRRINAVKNSGRNNRGSLVQLDKTKVFEFLQVRGIDVEQEGESKEKEWWQQR